MSNELSVITELNKQLPTLTKLMSLNGKEGVEERALQEISNFEEHMMYNPALAECTPVSACIAIKAAIRENLSLSRRDGLVYLYPESIKFGDKWIKYVKYDRTANGELSVAYQTGTIIDHKRPTVNYNDNGQVISVVVEIMRPTPDGAGRWESIEYNTVHMRRAAIAAHRKYARNKQDADEKTLNYAPAMYKSWNGSMDPEFATAKAIKFALKKLGTNIGAKHNSFITLSPEKLVRTDAVYAEAEDATYDVVATAEHDEQANATIITPTNIPSI